MGPLTKRIEARKPMVQVEAVIRSAVKDAKVAVAIFESKDGGLLVHTQLEREAIRG